MNSIKNIITKYRLLNVLIGSVMYIAYRIVIAGTSAPGSGLLNTILYILDIVVNLGVSVLHLAAMVSYSFTVFLNRFTKTRKRHFLSWLSFSGPGVILFVMLIISMLSVNLITLETSMMYRLIIFSIYIS